MTTRKAFEDVVTPWEIRAFHGNPNVQRLLRGEFYNPNDPNRDYDNNAYLQACRDYVVAYAERHSTLPSDDCLEARYFDMYLEELICNDDPRYQSESQKQFVERLLRVATKVPEDKVEQFIDDIQSLGGGMEYVTAQDMTDLLKLSIRRRVTELSVQNKPGVTAAAAPEASKG